MRGLVAFAFALGAAAGCGGGGGGGEPIGGTITITVGADTIVPDSGAALEAMGSPTEMSIVIADVGIDCADTLDTLNDRGTYVVVDVDRTAPGTHMRLISVVRLDSTGGHLNASTGTITIDAIGAERVLGSLTMTTTDDEVGPIGTSGTFDLIRCF